LQYSVIFSKTDMKKITKEEHQNQGEEERGEGSRRGENK
jgi:hypothetical protein